MKDNFKSGFAAIIGAPNVGKSTLLNAIVGQKIAIISDKPQTTRNKILAVHTTDTEQIIFTDTPGIHKPHNRLGEYMVNAATTTMRDTDIIILVLDASRKLSENDKRIAEDALSQDLDCILVINKVDIVDKEKLLPIIAEYSSLGDFAEVIPISAKRNDGVKILLDAISKYLPEGPMMYDEDAITDQPERQIAAEIIREKLLWLLDKEIPHGIAIEIEKVEEKDTITNINAVIYCEKASHKGIVIGKSGAMLKKVGELARKDIERMLDKKVYLELWVKVKADWRNNNYLLRNFGFDENDD